MLGIVAHVRQRHLMGTPGALDLEAVDPTGTGPALRGAQHDHGPVGPATVALDARGMLDLPDLVQNGVQGLGHGLMHDGGIVADHVVRAPTVAAQQTVQLGPGDARQDRGVGDLVPVEMQNRDDGAVADGVAELVGVPAGRQWAGLGLAVADHAGHDQTGVVERRTEGVRQGIAQFTALVYRPGNLRGDMAGHATGKRELPEQGAHTGLVASDVGVGRAIAALQPGVGQRRRAAVAGADDVHQVEVALVDDPIEMSHAEVDARRGSPMSQQAWLDVFGPQRLSHQRVVQ